MFAWAHMTEVLQLDSRSHTLKTLLNWTRNPFLAIIKPQNTTLEYTLDFTAVSFRNCGVNLKILFLFLYLY